MILLTSGGLSADIILNVNKLMQGQIGSQQTLHQRHEFALVDSPERNASLNVLAFQVFLIVAAVIDDAIRFDFQNAGGDGADEFTIMADEE